MSEELAGQEAAQSESVPESTVVTETTEPTEGKEPEKTGDPKVDDPWPKSARNAMSRRDKQLGRYKEQLSAYDKRIADMQKQIEEFTQKSRPENKEPREEDFENYGDFLKAVAKYKPQEPKEQVDPKKIQEQAFHQARQQLYYNQRVEAVAQQAQKAMQEVPGLEQMLEEHSDVLDTFPPAVEMAFLEAENAPMAFLALAREGKLESLAHMTPTQAAYTIAQAQIRGEQMAKASKVSKAPTPISGAKGVSPGIKGLPDLKTVDEVMNWVNKK